MTKSEIMEVLNKQQEGLHMPLLSDSTTVQIIDRKGPLEMSTIYTVKLVRGYDADGYRIGWLVKDIQPPPDEE